MIEVMKKSELWRKVRYACNLRWHWIGFRLGMKNVWRFRSAVWRFDTCDYTPLLELMRIATAEMARDTKAEARLVDYEKRSRQLLIVSELCRRLQANHYFNLAGYGDGSDWNQKPHKLQRRIAAHSEYLAKQDQAYLGVMFRHLRCWWY